MTLFAKSLAPQIAGQLAQGLALQKQGQLAKAQAIYEQVLQSDPEHFDALHLLAMLLSKKQEHQESLALLNRALKIKQNNAVLFYNRGNVLQRLKQFEAALASYDQALALKPDYVNAFSNRGNVLQELKQLEAALISYDRAIALKPDFADAYLNRGKALQRLKQFAEALSSYDRAIELMADQAQSEKYFVNRSALKKEMGHLQSGIDDLKQACQIRFKNLREQPNVPLEEITKPMSVPDAARALLEFKQFMDQRQIPFFLIKGTLLGIYRDGEQLPYDKDIDLGLFWETDRPAFLKEIKHSSSFKVVGSDELNLAEHTWNIVLEHIPTEVVLDLFFFKPEAQSLVFGFHHSPEPFLWKFSAFELAPIEYRGQVFQAPQDPERFLSEIYGAEWRKPDPYFNSVVSGKNVLERCRLISVFYGYDYVYEILNQGDWKKVIAYCQQIKSYETEPWLADLISWSAKQIKDA
jgi:tetratricopeptide (TPR) repeat protein